MEKRQTHKDIELGGRKWRIEKFDARTGSYICLKILPMLMGAGLTQGINPETLAAKAGMLITQMSKSEFFEIQTDCLAQVSELQTIGATDAPIPLLHQSGKISVPDVEKDTMLILALTGHVLAFNISDFFASEVLKDLGKSIQALGPTPPQK